MGGSLGCKHVSLFKGIRLALYGAFDAIGAVAMVTGIATAHTRRVFEGYVQSRLRSEVEAALEEQDEEVLEEEGEWSIADFYSGGGHWKY